MKRILAERLGMGAVTFFNRFPGHPIQEDTCR